MRGSNIKISEVIGGITILAGGLFFAFFFLAITAFPSTAIIVSSSLFAWILETSVPIGMIEGGIYWLKQSLLIDTNKIEEEKVGNSFLAKMAHTYAVLNRYSWIPAIIVLLSLLVMLVYFFITKNSNWNFNPRFEFYFFIFIYIIYYFLLRKSIFSILSKFEKYTNQFLPTYVLENEEIRLDLKILDLSNRSEKHTVKILFSELDEIKELTYLEALSLLQYQIGPDLRLGAAAVKDQYDYLKGVIPKPRYYIYGPSSGNKTLLSSGVKTLLLRGENIFYLVSVGNIDNNELIKSFQASKSSKY